MRDWSLWVLCGAAASLGCGDEPDPCAGVAERCVAVHVSSSSVDAIDHLELDLLYDGRHSTVTSQVDGGRVASLPVVVGVTLETASVEALAVGVVAAGKVSGVVLGTGAGSLALDPGQHARMDIRLAAPEECVASSFYCGGDKVAGDPQTLYQCNAGGVPLARGVCEFGCVIRPGDDDTCRGGGGACVEGGFYCGGDKLDGDPQTLYRCASGAGTAGVECADGCVVQPGVDDACR